jgi:hypothetical protein
MAKTSSLGDNGMILGPRVISYILTYSRLLVMAIAEDLSVRDILP